MFSVRPYRNKQNNYNKFVSENFIFKMNNLQSTSAGKVTTTAFRPTKSHVMIVVCVP